MTTTPEKRLNKHGVLVTKHVLASPRSASAKSLPAPSPISKGPTSSAPNIRPAQKQSQPRDFSMSRGVDGLLADKEELSFAVNGRSRYDFNASDQEFYAVLGTVDSTENALHMLSQGVRSAEDAYAYLDERGASHLAVDNSSLTNEMLDSNISVDDFVENQERLRNAYPDTEHLADLMILNTMKAIRTQRRDAEPFIARGEVSLDDIRELGMKRLKSLGRLTDSLPALADIRTNPNSKIKLDDVAWLMDKVSESLSVGGDTSIEYKWSAEAMVSEGKEAIEPIKKFSQLSGLVRNYKQKQYTDHLRKAVYASIVLQITPRVTMEDMEQLFDSGISAQYAGDALLKGISVETMIDARDHGIADSVADGWL